MENFHSQLPSDWEKNWMLENQLHFLLYTIPLHQTGIILMLLFQTTLCREVRPGNGILHLHQVFHPKVKRWIAEQTWTAKPIKPLLKRNPKRQQEVGYFKSILSRGISLHSAFFLGWGPGISALLYFFSKNCFNNVHLVHCIEIDNP